MAVLSADQVQKRLALSITDPKSLVITPMPHKQAYDEDSIDLRLGAYFLMPQIPPQPYIDPGGSEGFENYLQLHVPLLSIE